MVYLGGGPDVTGPLFMRPYIPHAGHIIKMADETRNATPVAVTDDTELFTPLKPSTIYTVRIVLFISAGIATGVWYPACTSAVDFCALFQHRSVTGDAANKWRTLSAGDHAGHVYDTTRFNANSTFGLTNAGSRSTFGTIQTGSGGGTFSIKWGGGNGTRTLYAGSFMYLKEALTY
jgi:hypothetical protein